MENIDKYLEDKYKITRNMSQTNCNKALRSRHYFKLGYLFATKEREQKEAEQQSTCNLPHVRFQLPSDKQLFQIALLFNNGKIEHQKLADMVAMASLIIDRLYDNGDVSKPCRKEGN
jgi:hypothetical protein